MPSYVDRLPPVLHDGFFRRYWLGQSASQIGDQIGGLAMPLVAVLVLHTGPVGMGMLLGATGLPSLLLATHAGAWVDRHGRRRQVMIAADLARLCLFSFVALAYRLGTLSLPLLVALTVCISTASLLFRVAAAPMFAALVPKERYIDGSAALQGSRAAAWLVGPNIGGFLVGAFSAPVALLANALSFVLSALSLATIRPEEPSPTPARAGHTVAGLRFIQASPVLSASLGATATLGLFGTTFLTLYVLYVTRDLGVTPTELGLILGPSSVGALFGSAVARRTIARLGLGPALVFGTAFCAVPSLLVPLAGGLRLLVLAMLFAAELFTGLGLFVLEIGNGAMRAAPVPDPLRARVEGAFALVGRGIGPVGALLAALCGQLIGLHLTVWLAAGGAALAWLWLWRSPLRSMGDLSAFAPPQSPGSKAGATPGLP